VAEHRLDDRRGPRHPDRGALRRRGPLHRRPRRREPARARADRGRGEHGRESCVRCHAAPLHDRPHHRAGHHRAQPRFARGAVPRIPTMTQRLRDDLVTTAKQMSALGLTPGMSGNVSVRYGDCLYVTPSGMPYPDLVADDIVKIEPDGSVRPGQRSPTTEWRLHKDILGARQDVHAIVHTHSLFCTTISTLRRAIPAIHYMVVLAGSDDIPCAEYATFGSAELALNAISALRGGNACLLANHGMIALGESLPKAL